MLRLLVDHWTHLCELAMPRRLPWQVQNNGDEPSSSKRSTPARSKRKAPILDSSDVEYSPAPKSKSPMMMRSIDGARDRSSSLPLGPPAEEFMIEGFRNDDRFRLVEDEFMDVAKDFTQHLHAAEYLRLKNAAKSRNVDAIQNIARPLSIPMPDQTRRKVEGVARAKKQAKAINDLKRKKALDDSDSEAEDVADPWLGTALHGLMEETRAPTTTVTDLDTSIKSRAAAGIKCPGRESANDHVFDSAEEEGLMLPPIRRMSRPADQEDVETEDDDDDLDAVPSPRKLVSRLRSSPPLPEPIPRYQAPIKREPRADDRDLPIKQEKDVEIVPRTSADVQARMAKRREQARLKRLADEKAAAEAKVKKEPSDIIPRFL